MTKGEAMTACFHLPSVVCENCAHLRSTSAPHETRTFTTTTKIIWSPDSGATTTPPKKRLYTVSVEVELAVYAEDESHARRQAHAAASEESYNATVFVSKTVWKTPENLVDVLPPHGWDKDCLVYGTDEDMTLAEAIERERAALLIDGGEP